MADLEFLPIDLETNWATIFSVIEENFRRIRIYLLGLYSSIEIEQFDGDSGKTNNFTLTYSITDDTSIIVFRKDHLYGRGRACANYSITNNILTLKTDLAPDEGVTVEYIHSNTLMDDANYFIDQVQEVEAALRKQLEDASSSTLNLKSFLNYVDEKSKNFGAVVGNTDITHYGDGTLTGALKEMIDLLNSKETILTPTQKATLDSIVGWDLADDAQVHDLMIEILGPYTTETFEEMQQYIASAGQQAQRAITAKEDAVLAKVAAQNSANIASINAGTSTTAASDSEAYAVGTRGGVDVGPTDPAYHNNSKYYAEESLAPSIAGMTDVDLTSLEDGYILKYDESSSKWVSQLASSDVEVSEELYNAIVKKPDGLYVASVADYSKTYVVDDLDLSTLTLEAAISNIMSDVASAGKFITGKFTCSTGSYYLYIYNPESMDTTKGILINSSNNNLYRVYGYPSAIHVLEGVDTAWSAVSTKPFSSINSDATGIGLTVVADKLDVTDTLRGRINFHGMDPIDSDDISNSDEVLIYSFKDSVYYKQSKSSFLSELMYPAGTNLNITTLNVTGYAATTKELKFTVPVAKNISNVSSVGIVDLVGVLTSPSGLVDAFASDGTMDADVVATATLCRESNTILLTLTRATDFNVTQYTSLNLELRTGTSFSMTA